MVIEILSYSSSILNPLLKIGITIGFVCAAYILYQGRKRFGGILSHISTLLLVVAVAGVIASLFRLEGDFYDNYKWGESIVGLILVITSLIIALIVRRKIHEIAALFSCNEEDT